MKKSLLAGLVLALVSVSAIADGGKPDVPFPLRFANRFTELAADAPYTLKGKVVIKKKPGGRVNDPGRPYISVDLKAHPWLANPGRAKDASYPLVGDPVHWEEYEGDTLSLTGYARKTEVLMDGVTIDNSLVFREELSFEPKLVKILKNARSN